MTHNAEIDRTPDRWVITTPKGFTESFSEDDIRTLVLLGLIEHERDGYVLIGSDGIGVGALHHFYREASHA
jgi:hypothetical protein